MPSPVISGTSSAEPKANENRPSTSKTRRLVRRRGRGRGEMSDEEFEREALTDSGESQLTMDSDSDSEDEKAQSKTVVNGAPQDAAGKPFVRSSAPSPAPKNLLNSHKSTIPASTNWSDMVTADEVEASELPVVDFEDLGKLASDVTVATHDSPSTSTLSPAQLKAAKQKAKRKAKKEKLKALAVTNAAAPGSSSPQPPVPAQGDVPSPADENAAFNSAPNPPPVPLTDATKPLRPPKVNARQAYLDRLTNDPSYVPRVGAFWGHDDRLMDKELRSMSPWWRGRGRGRGVGYIPTGMEAGYRGRGGFAGGRGRGGFSDLKQQHAGASDAGETESHSRAPSVARTAGDPESWSRLAPTRGHWSEARGRGGARGRGFGTGRARAPSNATPRSVSTVTHPPEPSSKSGTAKPTPRPGRKTERAWTKPLDDSLIANANGSNTGPRKRTTVPSSPASSDVRIKLPGTSTSASVPVTPDVLDHRRTPSSHTDRVDQRSEVGSVSERPKSAVVKLPARHKMQVSGSVVAAASAAAKSAESVKSPLAAEVTLPSQIDQPTASQAPSAGQEADEKDPFIVHMPPDEARADAVRQSLNGTAPASTASPTNSAPSAAPLAPSSRPDSTAPPPFSSPYAAPQPQFSSLPPGVAYGDNGMLFELATGRPVILAPPQPVPSMFHPPPRMVNPYAPSFTPRQFTHYQTPPAGTHPLLPPSQFGANGYPLADSPGYSPYPLDLPAMDAAAPIFVPARSSAVEIRAPSEDAESAGGKSSTTTSGSSVSTSVSASIMKSAKPSTKQPSSLRTSVSAPADLATPDMTQSVPKEATMLAQPQYAPQPYANGGYYYPGPEYAVYAPVPISMDGQPQYGAFYPDPQYAMPPYNDANPYAAGYGAVYYGPGPYGVAGQAGEGEMPRYY